ncbi:MAG: hypothetical protein HOV83_03115 [Catenulispora sp.]|nr:hypothetical protein [Catenulispora sp.]
MTENRLKGRVKGLFGGAAADEDVPIMPLPEPGRVPVQHAGPGPEHPDSDSERQALQVLVLARRTADEHVSLAQHEADKIRADARTRAEQVNREAQASAESVRLQAENLLNDARARAEQLAREAQANAENLRQQAEKTLADARTRAEEIVSGAEANADTLDQEAQQRYQDVVGSLEGKRAAIQRRIEALQQFDREYRARLATFMQGQLRALGTDVQPNPLPADLDPNAAEAADDGEEAAQ